jgi:hypothetical protein
MEKFYLKKDDEYCFIEESKIYCFMYHIFSSLVGKIELSSESMASYNYLQQKIEPECEVWCHDDVYRDKMEVLIYRKRLYKNLDSLNTDSSINDIREFFINLKQVKIHCDVLLNEMKVHQKAINAFRVEQLVDHKYYYGNLNFVKVYNHPYDDINKSSFGKIFHFNKILKNPFDSLLSQWEALFDDKLNLKNVEYLTSNIEQEYFHYVIYCENKKKETGFWGPDSAKTRYGGNAQLFSLSEAKLFQTEKQARIHGKNGLCLSNYVILKVKTSLDSVLDIVGKPNTQKIDLFKANEEKELLENKMNQFNEIKDELTQLKTSDLAHALSQLCPYDEELNKALAKYLTQDNQKIKTHRVKV